MVCSPRNKRRWLPICRRAAISQQSIHQCRIHRTWYVSIPYILVDKRHLSNSQFKGMPRILLSSASLAPLVLDALGLQYSPPQLAASYPALPQPFHATEYRIAKLQDTNPEKVLADYRVQCEASARKPFCNIDRVKGIQSSPHL